MLNFIQINFLGEIYLIYLFIYLIANILHEINFKQNLCEVLCKILETFDPK